MLAVILSLALAGSSTCSWDRPGANPYRLSGHAPSAALHDYHLPSTTEQALKRKMDATAYDDVVEIKRDTIVGKSNAYEHLRGMHSGHGQYCGGDVTRTGWEADHVERGLVYCEGDTCVVVPTICNNVALLTKKPDELDIEPAAGPGGGGGPMGLAPVEMDQTALDIEPAAGPVAPMTIASADEGTWSDGAGFGDSPPYLGGVGGGGTGGSGDGPGNPGGPGPGGGDGDGGGGDTLPPITAVPEPGTFFLWAFGIALVGLCWRHRQH